MKYPIAIEPGIGKRAWGVVVPDLPGCFSAGRSGLDDAIEKAKEAIVLWIDEALDQGRPVPNPSLITTLQKKREFRGWVWAVVEIAPEVLSDDIERINITLPKRVLARIDAAARRAGDTRSGYIARLALNAPARS